MPWLLARTSLRRKIDDAAEFNVVVTDDTGIAPLNSRYFGRFAPTDVISFAYPPSPERHAFFGELIVNVERAAACSPDLARELALYLAHGCDHLAGASDRTPAQRRRMLRRERAWLRQADQENLLAGLAQPSRAAKRTRVLDGIARAGAI